MKNFEVGKIYATDGMNFWARIEIVKMTDHYVTYKIFGDQGDNKIRRAKIRTFNRYGKKMHGILVCSMYSFTGYHKTRVYDMCYANDEI